MATEKNETAAKVDNEWSTFDAPLHQVMKEHKQIEAVLADLINFPESIPLPPGPG